jgi:hypothetical protein
MIVFILVSYFGIVVLTFIKQMILLSVLKGRDLWSLRVDLPHP